MGGYTSTVAYNLGLVSQIEKPEFNGHWGFAFEPNDGGTTPAGYPAPFVTMGDHARLTLTSPEGHQTEYFYHGINEETWVILPKHYQAYVNASTNNSTQPKRTYDYNDPIGRSRLSQMSDEAGHTTQYQYDAQGLRTKVIDPGNIETDTTYTASSQLTQRVEDAATGGEQRTTQFSYLQPHSNLISQIVSPGRIASNSLTTNITYDSNRYPNTVTLSGKKPNGSTTTRQFDADVNAQGQLTQLNGPRTDVTDTTQFTYHNCSNANACEQLASVSNALNQTITISSYTVGGLPETIIDPNGLVTEYTYDALQRVNSIIRYHPDQGLSRDGVPPKLYTVILG